MLMKVINWLDLSPNKQDLLLLQSALDGVDESMDLKKLCQLLVRIILKQYPWDGRKDLVELFDPGREYGVGNIVAFLEPDPQQLRLPTWRIVKVDSVKVVKNQAQGSFQVVHFENPGMPLYAAGIQNAEVAQPNPNSFLQGNQENLVVKLADRYAGPLKKILQILVAKKLLPGEIRDETYFPEPPPRIPPEELAPFFDVLTTSDFSLSVDEICQGLENRYPKFATVSKTKQRDLVRTALSESSDYFYLGGDLWTTQELYDAGNRPIQQGLPVPHVRSKIGIWTKQDLEDLAPGKSILLPPDAIPDEEVTQETNLPVSPPSPAEWRPPSLPLKLPTLNYLHITQAYFPVTHLMSAFHPLDRIAKIQWMDSPSFDIFNLDRDDQMLKARAPEAMRSWFLDAGIPAGTYLWLEYVAPQHYRITPRLLPDPRWVPCKLATIEDAGLHIEHTEIPMWYEGDPQVFKADMRFEDIDALFAEAKQTDLSIRDAIILALEELSDTDQEGRAYYTDIFNAVFLIRMCSYNSVRQLLYNQPCFVQCGGGHFKFDATCTEEGLRRKIAGSKLRRSKTSPGRGRASVSHPGQPSYRPSPPSSGPSALVDWDDQNDLESSPTIVPEISSEAEPITQVLAAPAPEIETPPEAEPGVETLMETVTVPEAEAPSEPEPVVETLAESGTAPEPEASPEPEPVVEIWLESDAVPEPEALPEPESVVETLMETITVPEPESLPEPELVVETLVESDTVPEPGTPTEPEPVVATLVESDTVPELEVPPEPEPVFETLVETITVPEPAAPPEPEPVAEMQTESVAVLEPEAILEPEPVIETLVESGIVSEPEASPEPEPVAETRTESVAVLEPDVEEPAPVPLPVAETLSEAQPDPIPPYEPEDHTARRDLSYYLDLFRRINRAPIHSDWARPAKSRAPHKPFLLLSVMDLIANGVITENRIEITPELTTQFSQYWVVTLPDHLNNLAAPFFHLRSNGFWHLIPVPGQEEKLQALKEISGMTRLQSLVSGAFLDDELFQLMQTEESRRALRVCLVESHFLPDYQSALVNPLGEPLQSPSPASDETVDLSMPVIAEALETQEPVTITEPSPALSVDSVPDHEMGVKQEPIPAPAVIIQPVPSPEPLPAATPAKPRQRQSVQRIWAIVQKTWKRFKNFIWRKSR